MMERKRCFQFTHQQFRTRYIARQHDAKLEILFDFFTGSSCARALQLDFIAVCDFVKIFEILSMSTG